MLLTDILEKNSKKFPERPALIMRRGYRTVSLSYKEVYDLSLKIACLLQNQGIQKGDKVLISGPNSPYWICVFWASLLRGAVLVPLNVQSTSEMLRKIAEQTKAKIIFKHLHFKSKLPPNLQVYDIELLKEEVGEIDCSPFKKTALSESDLVEIMYTSGTTGAPKGVMLTHSNIYSNVEAVSKAIPISQDDKFLSVLPLSHIFEQVAGFLIPFKNAAPIIYAHSPAAIPDLLKEYRVTKMAGVPEFLRLVMSKIEAKAEEQGKKKLFEKMMVLSNKIGVKFIQRLLFHSVHKQLGGRFRLVASGGAPLDPELEEKWNALGITLLQGYGLTETSPVVSINTWQQRRLGSVGKILPGVRVKIGQDGEILVKGPNVFQEYFKNKEKTKEAFTADAWFQTGDIGELDKDGFLFLKGRKKYIILGPGGQNVYPEDIEFELNKIPGLKDSSVVGLEKPGGQIEIQAVLLPSQGAETKNWEKIIEKANKNLASYQQITGWSVWPKEDFPRSATRKVKKEEVLKWLRAKEKEPPDVKALEGEGRSPLKHLLAEVTGTEVAQIKSSTKIVPELLLDSLLRVELVARIEETLGVVVEETKITPLTTVSDLEEMIKTTKPLREKRQFKDWPLSWWASFFRMIAGSFFVFPLTRIFVKLKARGRNQLRNLPLPAIFMPNHISFLDSLVVTMALPLKIRRRVAFAAAQDILSGKYRYLSWLAAFFNAFAFPRQEQENIKSGLEYMGRLLDKNWSVIIYPEGKVSLTGKLQPLKRGAGLIALEMDSVIVPIKIIGLHNILPYGKIIPRRRGLVTVKFGRPLKFRQRDSYIQATEKIEAIMRSL